MHQILCSTGALIGRPNGRDYRLLKQFCPQLECDGFEFMLYSTWYDQIDMLTAFLESIQLNIPVIHCEKSLSEHISIGGDEELREALQGLESIFQRWGCSRTVSILTRLAMSMWNTGTGLRRKVHLTR